MIICRCNEVSLQEIKKFLKTNPHASLEDLKLHTSASTNCGRCKTLVEKTYQKIKKEIPLNDQLRISF